MALQSTIQVLRALSAHIARKAIGLFAILDTLLLIVLIVGIWALAYYVSSWWWLLLLLYIPIVIISLLIYFIAVFITSRLYRGRLSRAQRRALDGFVGKIMQLLEVRGMGWWVFLGLCIRDLVLYRELRTLAELLDTTKSLKHDFSELENSLL